MDFLKLSYKANYKIKSFALGASIALHCMILLCALLCSYFYVQKTVVLESPQKKATSKRRATPAPVQVSQKARTASPQVQKKMSVPQVKPQEEPRKASPQAAPAPVVKKIKPKAQQQPKEKPKPVEKHTKAQPKEEKKKAQERAYEIPKETTSHAHIPYIFPASRSTGYTAMPRYSSRTSHFAYRPRRRRRRSSGSGSKITPAQFMQAFRTAYRADQESQARRDQYAGHSHDGHDSVQRQLNEFKYANYNTKVNEVLESSFSMYSAPIYFDRDIYQQISVSLIIGPQGEVIEVKLVQPTGYEPLDNHITSVIKKSHFAPIPKHLNCDRYAFNLAPWVDVKKGTGTVTYRYMR